MGELWLRGNMGGGIIEKIMRRFRILVLTPCFLFMEINPSVSWIFIAEIIGCFFPLTHPEIKILQHCFHLPPYLVFSLHIDPDSLCSCIYRAGYTRPAGTDHPWLNKYTTRLRYTHTLVQDQCNNWTCVLYILYAFAFLQIELIGSWSIIQKSLICRVVNSTFSFKAHPADRKV